MDELQVEKYILDACCGGKQFWFDKNHKHTIYMDKRKADKGSVPCRPNWNCTPDIIGDYRDTDFQDKEFKLIVWDIPHKLKEDSGLITTKYGFLGENWREDTQRGFNELWRILDDFGTLIFKFADREVAVKEMLSLFPVQPLFGTPTRKGVNNTFWFCFLKIPE
jgi:hypothetical protein